MSKEPIPSPYQDILDSLNNDRSYFDFYDDLPASSAWMHSIGAALGRVFGVTVKPDAEEWEIDFKTKEMRAGSIEQIYTRRGVLGLLLNGIGRLGFGMNFPKTTKDAQTFAKSQNVNPDHAKHFGALARIVDEIRTDDKISKEYAGGERVVSTMHAQAYEGAAEQLRMMALDMRARREMARAALEWLEELNNIVMEVGKLGVKDSSSKAIEKAHEKVAAHFKLFQTGRMQAALKVTVWDSTWMNNEINSNKTVNAATGRIHAAILIALHPENTDAIAKTLLRSYDRNVAIFGDHLSYDKVTATEEKEVIQVAGRIKHDIEEIKALASHSGGHAQYVLAKAEQFYHGHTLGMPMTTPYFGYDVEARALDVEAANDSARELALALLDHGFTKDVAESIEFAKELLPIVSGYPFLDLNDSSKKDDKGKGGQGGGKGGGNMNQRVMGAGKQPPPKQKRQKERESKSQGDRAKDRRRMEAKDNKQNQKDVDEQRGGYSILAATKIDPLNRYLYIIGPYLGRISSTAAKMRRILKVNDPLGLRGAYRRGKALNPKVMYKHHLDDYKMFAKKEVDKDLNYGFVLMGDISGSTEQRYNNAHNRTIEDEVLASAFIITEVAERIGDKVMCAVGFFTSGAETVKRAGFYLNRTKIITDITEHGGGTNVAAAGEAIAEDLQEMEEFKVKNKTVVFITDGGFYAPEFMKTLNAAKKYKASIAYFSIADNQSGVAMCKEVERFVGANAKGVRIRTRNIAPDAIHTLPEAIAQLMKETVTTRV
jgi:hypothetical protein